ncbi:bifunctional lysylphosphatidylglycerol synthetase/lysine--tRNA ligase LysX [Corynebacterium anserum]|uniref:bifunctional lysylphosphatidylglycerol synthetase/lysine--tRNA ligase LysX n=1 Tax=Corynebacterium anserum TaxID=2684406 RepID=UPI00163AD410|nr:bifunctional lysylphosphatidylglycerol synthetase/lysine--tRNA ligase LysX [Corynebacterium anserum]MBC2681793.1 bifunctional lysylphosphatidylglycerol synthetase/lysine--tRNA ligase LysX [Corynebacterium anserum]
MKQVFERYAPRIIGGSLLAYGFFGFLLVVSPTLRHTLKPVAYTLDALFLPVSHLSMAWSVFIAVLGAGLWRCRRAAWVTSVAGLVLLNVGNLLFYTFSPETFEIPPDMGVLFQIGTVIQALMLVFMVLLHPLFTTRTRRINVRAAALTWLVGTLLVSVLAVALVFKFPGSLVGSQRVGWALNHAALLSLVDRSFFDGHAPRFVAIIISIAAAFVLLVTFFVAVRSQRSQNSASATDEAVVRSMIKRFNQNDSLAYFATRRDKSIVYAPNGRAAVTYRVEVGSAIASADPIGEPDSWDAAIDAFRTKAAEFGWTTGAMGASEEGARAYQRNGMRSMHLGDEAVIYTDTFDLAHPELKDVRQAVAHAQRDGVWIRVRRHRQIPAEEMQKVQERADVWRDTSEERGFSMALSRLGDEADGECVLVEALVGEGSDAHVVAQLSFVPWGSDGLSLDLMRRGPEAPNGTVEAMVAYLCSGDALNIRRISLNFAVFRSVFASESKVGVGPIRRLARKVLVFLSKWWQMEALYRSNVKYNPEWVPRYMCFDNSVALARTSVAAGIAEGFIPWIDSGDMRAHAAVETPGADVAVKAMHRWEAKSSKKEKKHNKQLHNRITTAQKLEESGVDPWAQLPTPTMTCREVHDAQEGHAATIAGRVIAKRKFGAIAFIDLADASGVCQVIINKKDLPEALPEGSVRPADVEVSDYIQVEGITALSKKGQPSLLAHALRFEAKALEAVVASGKNEKNKSTQETSPVRTMAQALTADADLRSRLYASAARMTQVRSELNAEGFVELEDIPEIDITLHLLAALTGGAARAFSIALPGVHHGLEDRVTELELIQPERHLTFMATHADEAWALDKALTILGKMTEEAVPDPRTVGFASAVADVTGQATVQTESEAREICQSLGLRVRPDESREDMLGTIFMNKVLPSVCGLTVFTGVPATVQLDKATGLGCAFANGFLIVNDGQIIASGYAVDTRPAEMKEDSLDTDTVEATQDVESLLRLGVPAAGCATVRL